MTVLKSRTVHLNGTELVKNPTSPMPASYNQCLGKGCLIVKVKMSFKVNLVKLRRPYLRSDHRIIMINFVNTTHVA
jgi:hypothetical protein